MSAFNPAFLRVMAAYNQWQNESLYGAASGLTDEERKRARGAFFGSIHATLSHILWGDRIWLSRFTDYPAPDAPIGDSGAMIADWDALKAERVKTDDFILTWTTGVSAADLEGELSWFSAAYDRTISMRRDLLLVHFFNHQTHHRGQAHAMLTAAGAKPGPTDLPVMPAFQSGAFDFS
ncbi:DinB family protein [Hyphococcus sp.]|uniref:DinB family protein n=1 Tax=Hyphococcus sp. TaxID=2038636 RepID=UPI003D0B5D56